MHLTRTQIKAAIAKFEATEARLKSVKPGDVVYQEDTLDPIGNAYFKHIVVSVDLDEMCLITKDMSQQNMYPGGKDSRLSYFKTTSEVQIADKK